MKDSKPSFFARAFAWCKKYVSLQFIVIVALLVYILFLQDYNIGRMHALNHTIDSLRTEIQLNRDTMEVYRALNERLDNHDPEIIERVVRENHNMNRANEDIYIFE